MPPSPSHPKSHIGVPVPPLKPLVYPSTLKKPQLYSTASRPCLGPIHRNQAAHCCGAGHTSPRWRTTPPTKPSEDLQRLLPGASLCCFHSRQRSAREAFVGTLPERFLSKQRHSPPILGDTTPEAIMGLCHGPESWPFFRRPKRCFFPRP